MAPNTTISINGAGIAGLTLAIGLAKFGFRVLVAEKQPHISEFGAGLQISPNARRALDALGLNALIEEKSFKPLGIDIYRQGKPDPLAHITLGDFATQRYGGTPYAVMHRADLVQQLYKATKSFPNIEILFGVSTTRIEDVGNGVSVIIEREGHAPFPVTARAHIGADGVRSDTRINALGGARPQYSGYVGWRAMANFNDLEKLISPERTALFWAPDYHLVAYPLPQRQQFNIALFTKCTLPVNEHDTPNINKKSLNKNKKLTAIMDSISELWTAWPLFGVSTPHWFKNNIAILGDAAHAMLPFQAQGAAMAIEDAVLLATLFAADNNNQSVFTKWQKLRKPRVDIVQNLSRKNADIFHLRPPLSWGRDVVVSQQSAQDHLERLDWIYKHDPFEGMVMSAQDQDI